MRSFAPFVAALLACAATSAPSSAAIIQKITVYFKTSDKTEHKAFVKDGAFGNGVSNVEWFTVASTYQEARIEFRARIRGQGETDWKKNGNQSVGGAGAVIEAVSFRLDGTDKDAYSLHLSVMTASKSGKFKPSEWAGFGDEPITGFVLTMINEVELKKLDDNVKLRKGWAADEIADAGDRDNGGRKILPELLATIGMNIGFIYGGPAGAIGGALLGYALGSAAQKTIDGAVAYTKDAQWGEKSEEYLDKLRRGRDKAGDKLEDWLAKVDPTKIGSKGFEGTPLDPKTWNPVRW